MKWPRAILHVDMDAFYASVEQLDDPALRGRPVLVAGTGKRGVVSAASYEARVFGCHSAQPTAVARRRCPEAVILPPRGARYREASRAVFAVLEQITPLVEPLSIDEAFLDVTGSQALLGEPPRIAADIRARVLDETGLAASVGVAPNKFLAKLASDWDKPDGLTILRPEELPARLGPLPVSRLWGVGPATEARLRAQGLDTFGDLQALTREEAVRRLGEHGEHFWRLARGEDDREVVPDHRAKSLGAEQTFGVDVPDAETVRAILMGQSERVTERLRRQELVARTVTVKIRFGDFETITRSQTVEQATDRTDEVQQVATDLFQRWVRRSFQPVRLIGMAVSQLGERGASQGSLFADPEREASRRVDRAADEIRRRFGPGAVHRGFLHTPRRPFEDDDEP